MEQFEGQRSYLFGYFPLTVQTFKAWKLNRLAIWLDPGLTTPLDANGQPDGFASTSFFFPRPVGSSVVVNTPPPTDFGSIVKAFRGAKASEGTYFNGQRTYSE